MKMRRQRTFREALASSLHRIEHSCIIARLRLFGFALLTAFVIVAPHQEAVSRMRRDGRRALPVPAANC
jgi:hypothetical protein